MTTNTQTVPEPSVNRRRFERFSLNAAYTPVVVRTLDSEGLTLEGHSYDLSEGGLKFEIDREIKPGTPVSVQITVPSPVAAAGGGSRTVTALGCVVWSDTEEPGPVVTGAVFSCFPRDGDKESLLRHLGAGVLRRAA